MYTQVVNPTSRVHVALLSIILIFSGVFRIGVMDVPFGRNPEGCAAFFGLVARNYFRYPFSAHHGVPVTSMGDGAPVMYYANHPPTTPLLIGAVFAITGYRGEFDPLPADWKVRFPTAAFTMGCIALIYFLVQRRARPRVALLASAIFAAIPMTLVYGGFPDVISPQLVFFAMLTIAAYERFHDSPSIKSMGILSAAFLGAAIMDWPAFLLGPVFGLHFIMTRKPKLWFWIIAFGVVTLVIFGLLYVYLATAQHNWAWMKSLVQRRSISTSGDADHEFGIAGWLKHALWDLSIGRHTLIVFVLGAVGVAAALARRGPSGLNRFMGLLLSWAMVHIFVGAQGVYRHEWWWWPLTPGLVIAAAVGLDFILRSAEMIFPNRVKCANVAAIIALCIFAGLNTRRALVEHLRPTDLGSGANAYSLMELGQAIRENTPPGSAAILAEKDDSLGFWYYADRACKIDVWDIDTFARRRNDATVELSFFVPQRFDSPPATMIIPKDYAQRVVARMILELDKQFPKRESGKFIIYDLTKPLPHL